ncbi:hypothetical protein BJ742DRAFT_866532 [Cladochytrium replicatum]|nr:hypothetical protein BJ742DRAFT_866532 [Cladochytrium replicatum]
MSSPTNSTTIWSTFISLLTFNQWFTSQITVSTIPAGYNFTYSAAAVGLGSPTVYVMDPTEYTSWETGFSLIPRTFYYSALVPPPSNTGSTSITFAYPTTFPVVVYCGRRTSSLIQYDSNCTSVNLAATWVDLHLPPLPTTTTTNRRSTTTTTTTPTQTESFEGGVVVYGPSVGSTAGVTVAVFAFACAVAAAVVVFVMRRTRRKDVQLQGAGYLPPPGYQVGQGYPPPPPVQASTTTMTGDGSVTASPGQSFAQLVPPPRTRPPPPPTAQNAVTNPENAYQS